MHASRIAMLLRPAHHRNDEGISMRPYRSQLSLFGTLYGVKRAKKFTPQYAINGMMNISM